MLRPLPLLALLAGLAASASAQTLLGGTPPVVTVQTVEPLQVEIDGDTLALQAQVALDRPDGFLVLATTVVPPNSDASLVALHLDETGAMTGHRVLHSVGRATAVSPLRVQGDAVVFGAIVKEGGNWVARAVRLDGLEAQALASQTLFPDQYGAPTLLLNDLLPLAGDAWLFVGTQILQAGAPQDPFALVVTPAGVSALHEQTPYDDGLDAAAASESGFLTMGWVMGEGGHDLRATLYSPQAQRLGTVGVPLDGWNDVGAVYPWQGGYLFVGTATEVGEDGYALHRLVLGLLDPTTGALKGTLRAGEPGQRFTPYGAQVVEGLGLVVLAAANDTPGRTTLVDRVYLAHPDEDEANAWGLAVGGSGYRAAPLAMRTDGLLLTGYPERGADGVQRQVLQLVRLTPAPAGAAPARERSPLAGPPYTRFGSYRAYREALLSADSSEARAAAFTSYRETLAGRDGLDAARTAELSRQLAALFAYDFMGGFHALRGVTAGITDATRDAIRETFRSLAAALPAETRACFATKNLWAIGADLARLRSETPDPEPVTDCER